MKKILILSANPINTNRLRLDEEVREIKAALSRAISREEFELINTGSVRIDDLRQTLLDNNPEIIHFSGHGTGTDGLVLENTSGEAQIVGTESLSDLFELFKEQIECVLLNACYSEIQASAIHQHIDCVIGMVQPIQDRAAINFSKGFYDAIFSGRNYADAFRFGCNAISLEGILDFSKPVLKSRNNKQNLIQPLETHWLENPEGPVPRESPFYVKIPAIESHCANEISTSGTLIRVQAPHKWGKTSLMVRIINAAEQQGYQTTCTNFLAIERESFANLDKFLQSFCLSITDALNIEDRVFEYCQASNWSLD